MWHAATHPLLLAIISSLAAKTQPCLSLRAHHKCAQAVAYSPSGKLRDPWTHPAGPLLQDDRGHGTIFRTVDGSLHLVVHRHFSLPKTPVQIRSLYDKSHRLSLGSQLLGSE